MTDSQSFNTFKIIKKFHKCEKNKEVRQKAPKEPSFAVDRVPIKWHLRDRANDEKGVVGLMR
jgi:hypothetical protein